MITRKFVKKAVVVVVLALPVVWVAWTATNAWLNRLAVAEALRKSAKWDEYNYTAIGSADSLTGIKSLIVAADYQSILSVDAKSKLPTEIEEFFRAYSMGPYSYYRQFRMPAGVSISWKPSKGGSMDDWLSAVGALDVARNATAEDKFGYIILLHTRQRSSGGLAFSNYLTGVSLEWSSIVVRRLDGELARPWTAHFFSEEKSPRSSADGFSFPNTGFFSQKDDCSYIVYEGNTIEEVAAKHGSVDVADCFFMLTRSDMPHAAKSMPVILRLYWNPEIASWLPDDLVVCSRPELLRVLPIF